MFGDYSSKQLDVWSGNQGYDPATSRCYGFLYLNVKDTMDTFLRKSDILEKEKKAALREDLEVGLTSSQSKLLREKQKNPYFSGLLKKQQKGLVSSSESSDSSESEQSETHSPN